MTRQGGDNGIEDVFGLFSGRGKIAANATEVLGSLEGAKASRDFLLHFEPADILFGQVVAERNGGVKQEGQDRFAVSLKTAQEILCFGVFGVWGVLV